MTHEELIKIREEKNLTKGEFAALIGITPMMQGRYEGGKIAIPEDVAEKAMATTKDVEKKVTVKKVTKEKTAKDTEKKVAKATKKKAAPGKKKAPALYIESMLGGTITADEIINRIPADAEAVYVKPENKAYWVKGDENGDVDLW